MSPFRAARFREHHLVLCLAIGAALLRLLPHPENTAPIGALALFAGAYLHNRSLWLIPLSALLLVDLFSAHAAPLSLVIGYCGFLLTAQLGRRLLMENDSNRRIAAAVPFAALICWCSITLGAVAAGPLSPGDMPGSLWNALPLLAWHMIGDGAYALLLFGLFKLTRELPFIHFTPLR